MIDYREQEIVIQYEAMANASAAMRAAALRDDWGTVARHEQRCSSIVSVLKTLGDLTPRDPVLRSRKADLIRQILADDAHIRALSAPWLKKLESLLSSNSTSQRLQRAYGASSLR